MSKVTRYQGEGEVCLEEVVITANFKMSGYSDSGCISGPPENCYPPEGESEIEVDDEIMFDIDGKEIMVKLSTLPEALRNALSSHFDKEADEYVDDNIDEFEV